MMLNENDLKKAPVYLQIRESIYNKIISGEYKAGERLPAEDMVEARAAGEEVCEYLEVEEGFPVLCSRRVAFDSEGVQIDLSYSVYRSDQYVLEVEYR